MRKFEYQSPRHNQGVSYGPYRFAWDLHAAWLLRRMTGEPVFDPNIGDVYKFWLYMRLPTGQMLRDGDGFSDGRQVNLGLTPLLAYAYTGDRIVKGDFLRQNGMAGDPIPILLLNDPDLAPEPSLASLPLTLDFGPILGSMVARTGWNLGPNRADVVVEMKGGGYHFGNHQHSDAGSFQIYYRGLQAVDLGQYHFYGTPYDMGFCKRSVSHSMMLAVDPGERFPGTAANDGGTRFVRSCPTTPQQATTEPMFANGRRISSSFGPSPQQPLFSYFCVDLKSAYSNKIQEYVRTFCFLNLENQQTPAVLIVLDNMTTASAGIQEVLAGEHLESAGEDRRRGGPSQQRSGIERQGQRSHAASQGGRARGRDPQRCGGPHGIRPAASRHPPHPSRKPTATASCSRPRQRRPATCS